MSSSASARRASRGLCAVAMAVCGACGPTSGPVTVEALVFDPSADDGVRLDDVTLDTVEDLSTGRGSLFDARGGLQMAGLTVNDAVQNGDDFEEMRDRTRGEGGHDMSPRMSWDGSRWLADDVSTLTYFTAWKAFEQVWSFAETIGDRSGATRDRSLVGFDAQIVAAEIFPVPILTSDNAAYAAPLDAWLTLRVTAQEGVPFAMSFAVLAHEFHHRVFHRNVFDGDAAFEVWRRRVSAQDSPDAEKRATRIIQGVDEGLADLFSLAATGDEDGLRRTFAQAGGIFAAEAARRDLAGDFAERATYEELRDNALDSSLLEGCRSTGSEDLFNEQGFNFYCLGTVVARTLWEGSEFDIAVLRSEVIPAVNRALSSVRDVIGGGTLFDVEVLFAPLVDELPPGARREVVCTALRARFPSIVDGGKVPSCP